MTFLDQPTRFLFFTGKGGVGKTAVACAAALRLADAGRRVLLVSTDPASNLGEMLRVRLGTHPTAVPGVEHLAAMDIDPDRAAEEYRERVVAPYRSVWTEPQLRALREQLAGACTVEIAAFDEFTGLLAGGGDAADYDHVLFDTAPTGHTLRLLSLPRAWTTFLASTTAEASCLGPHSGLKSQQSRFAEALAALGDPARTTLVLVTRPDRAALREAARSSGELQALGVRNQRLVVNGVFVASDPTDPMAAALEARGRDALAEMPDVLRALPTDRVPLRPFHMVGLPALRALLDDRAAARETVEPPPGAPLPGTSLAALVDEIEAPGHGLVMVMGKGGVGKTTIAAAVAAALARRGHSVHLGTTDPAAHVASTLAGEIPNLTTSRIDPAAETEAYVARVMSVRGARLDEAGKALLAEDLRSPCHEEVAVFGAFSRIVSQARSRFVVLDTAPTGHTLLLLDTAGAYHRQMTSTEAGAAPTGRIVTPLMRLRDPGYTKVLLVALAETTPVSEAAQLQDDLRRAGIEPFAWVINASLAATGSADPCLRQRIAAEHQQLARVRTQLAERLAVVPWQREEPVGPARLLALTTPQPTDAARAAVAEPPASEARRP